MQKAKEMRDTISPVMSNIREESENYIREQLEKNNGSIDFSEVEDEFISVVYDGGNHPEYASNAFSNVYGVSINSNNNIVVDTDDDSEYDLENCSWDEVYTIGMFIYDHIENKEA